MRLRFRLGLFTKLGTCSFFSSAKITGSPFRIFTISTIFLPFLEDTLIACEGIDTHTLPRYLFLVLLPYLQYGKIAISSLLRNLPGSIHRSLNVPSGILIRAASCICVISLLIRYILITSLSCLLAFSSSVFLALTELSPPDFLFCLQVGRPFPSAGIEPAVHHRGKFNFF